MRAGGLDQVPALWTVLAAVFAELGQLFPDAVFHQGADEVLDPAEGFVHEQCWQVICSVLTLNHSDCYQVLDPAGHFSTRCAGRVRRELLPG